MKQSRRMNAIETLAKYFAEQGVVPTAKEYAKMVNRPFSLVRVRRIVGPWSRVVMWVEKYYPDLMAEAQEGQEIKDEVIEALEEAQASPPASTPEVSDETGSPDSDAKERALEALKKVTVDG